MKLFNIKKSVSIIALGLAAVLGTSVAANAQGNRNHDQKKDIQNQQSVIQQQNQQRNRGQQDRGRGQQQREPDWTDRGQINPPRQIGGGFYNVHPNPVVNNTPRYRVYRNGGWYNTDNRGADLLRQAVNAGYQQGYAAGRADRNSRRGSSWGNNTIYRSGTYGWQSYVDRGQYQYYFQQGFQRGYQDGYNSRYQYGFNNGGSVGILGSILGSILNIQSY